MTSDAVDSVCQQVQTATQQLLGDTITVTDQGWRAPSLLPGWSRGHVATHLARNADALHRLVNGSIAGRQVPMYASDGDRDAEIEQGAHRSGLDLQIDLDTSAERLSEAFASVPTAQWDAMVTMRGGSVKPLRALPLGRLAEVLLHHLDLEQGLGLSDLQPEPARWVIDWTVDRITGRGQAPDLTLLATDGQRWQLGAGGRELTGETGFLLGWLTGRNPRAVGVTGADGLTAPSYG